MKEGRRERKRVCVLVKDKGRERKKDLEKFRGMVLRYLSHSLGGFAKSNIAS